MDPGVETPGFSQKVPPGLTEGKLTVIKNEMRRSQQHERNVRRLGNSCGIWLRFCFEQFYMPEETYPTEIAGGDTTGCKVLRFQFGTRSACVWNSIFLAAVVLASPFANAAAQTNLEVTATGTVRNAEIDTHTNCWGSVCLTFRCGPLTNGAGILAIRIAKMEGDPDEKFEIGSWNPMGWSSGLDDDGVAIRSFDWYTYSTRPRGIKMLEGDAELFCPSVSNDGVVKMVCGLNRAGTVISNAVLEKHGLTLKFLDVKNYARTIKEMTRTNHSYHTSDFYARGTGMPENVQDSYLFSIDDANGLMLSHWPDVKFFDAWGQRIQEMNAYSTSNLRLVRFERLPEQAKFTFYLRTPGSVKAVHFKVENIVLR